MRRSAIISAVMSAIAVGSVFLAIAASSAFGQGRYETVFNGHRIIYPESSLPVPGRHHTNYFFVDSDIPNPNGPDPNAETPSSLACVYKLVTGPVGCPIATTKNVPTGGIGAIAIVDAGDYPTAASDLHAFSSYFGIPDADFTVVYANGKKPPQYSDWIVEEALDIEWAHAMAPKAKLFLVESVQINTDPTWQAVQVAGQLVSQNGGGVVSMSWGIPEFPQEVDYDKYFIAPNVMFFAASGDSGLNVTSHPAASPNVISVGGTFFNRDNQGNFVNEQYYTGGGGGGLSVYEKRPSYQNVISN